MSISMKTASQRRSGFLRIAIVLIAFLLVPVSSAMAEPGIDIASIPKLKPYAYGPEAEFEAKTDLIRGDKPYSDDYLSYQLRLPKGWAETKHGAVGDVGSTELSDVVLSIVGRYVAPPKNLLRSYVVIEGQSLAHEISAQNWFVNFILKNGFSLGAMDVKSPREVEALYVQVDGDESYVVRARLLINGPRLIMIRYYLPQDNYDEEKVDQARIIQSFKLTKLKNEDIEKQVVYGFLDQSFFNYPSSWTLKAKDILSIERMNALLYQESVDGKVSVLEGHIRINVISKLLKTTMDEEISAFRKSINVKGYTLGPVIETLKYKYNPDIKKGQAQAYRLIASDPVNMKSYEYLASIMEGDDYYYITSMITPSRGEDFYTWAQNIEAFRIINESMRRTDAPKIDPSDPYYDYLKQPN